jgi:hypothetical protein
MSGFAPPRLADPDAFIQEVRNIIGASLTEFDGRYELDVVGTTIWGRPTP